MTMHIELTIGGTTALHVAVVNEGPTSSGLHRYRWVVDSRSPGLHPQGHVLHDREAGAAALAALVLARVERHPTRTTTQETP